MSLRSSAATDPGRVEKENRDGCFAGDVHGVYAVADGVGEAPGEFAARLFLKLVQEGASHLADTVRRAQHESDPARGRRDVLEAIARLFETANTDIYGWGRESAELRGAATTATLALLDGQGVFLAHVGDSRAYLVSGGACKQLTQDHTMAEELVRVGQLCKEETGNFRYRNVVSRTLGERAVCRPDLTYVDVAPGDTLLLTTDGVTDFASERAILDLLQERGTPGRTAERIVDLALKCGSTDNATAVVVQVPEDTQPKTTVSQIGQPFAHTVKLDFIGTLFFCQHLTPDERMKVLRYVHEVQALPGTVVFQQGEVGQDLFLVVQGQLEVTVDGQKVTTIGPGGHFGEIALVSGQPRSATVVAKEPTRLFRLTRDDFFDLSQRDQAVAVKMLWSFSQTLSSRVTDLSRQVAGYKRVVGA
jgi:protein phosphatase